jgi:hypothetical protein
LLVVERIIEGRQRRSESGDRSRDGVKGAAELIKSLA